jgi:hypothetical protein
MMKFSSDDLEENEKRKKGSEKEGKEELKH